MAINANAQHLVDTLRSDLYPQGSDVLHRDGKYCPLGVGCDLYDNTRWALWSASTGIYTYLGASSYMPAIVREHYGIAYGNGDFTIDDDFKKRIPQDVCEVLVNLAREYSLEEASLADEDPDDFGLHHCTVTYLNDSGIPFPTIALVIEAEPPGLFGPVAAGG